MELEFGKEEEGNVGDAGLGYEEEGEEVVEEDSETLFSSVVLSSKRVD